MNQYKKDDKAIKSDQAENAQKPVEKVASLHKKESLNSAEQGEKK